MELIPHRLTAVIENIGIRSLVGVGKPVSPLSHSVSLPPIFITQRCTSMHFDENQLSPSLISLSLLSTTHPRPFQRPLVRTSTQSYLRFILVMDRSLGFGSATYNLFVLLTLAFALAAPQKGLTLLHTATRRVIKQKVRGHTFTRRCIVLPQLVSI